MVPPSGAALASYNPDGKRRAWGGVNVLYVGDFLQIPPAGETPLCTPANSVVNLGGLVNTYADEGLELFWNTTNAMIMFKKQMRCEHTSA